MKIVMIMPGYVENYYCENCLRDNTLLRAFRELGHDSLAVPLYMPPRFDEPEHQKSSGIFYGGINVFFQQKFGFFRKSPRMIDWLLDRPGLLRRAARQEHRTKAGDLGELTLSTLQGKRGRQVKELNRLVAWLKAYEVPDMVLLSNALLTGFVEAIKDALDVPVVCLLQDEDDFLDALPTAQRDLAWQVLQVQTNYVDMFVAGSDYYTNVMAKRLNLPDERLSTLPFGLFPDDYCPGEWRASPPTVGYLSQVRHEKGLDLLADAFINLKKNPRLSGLRLRIAGDRKPERSVYMKDIVSNLDRCGLLGDVDVVHEFSREKRAEFLKTLTVLSVPQRQGEANGMYVLESLAMGVPVVQPNNGVFPEWIEKTGGGVIIEADNVDSLAVGLEKLLLDPEQAAQLGRLGRQNIIENFDAIQGTRKMSKIFEEVIKNHHDRK